MKKQSFTLMMALLLMAAVYSCKNDSSTNPQPAAEQPEEFIADDNTFKDFDGWHLHATKMGVDPAMLKEAHGGNDSTSVRKIYFPSQSINRVDGQFPIGTIVSKKTTWQGNGGGSMITAMAKRGNGFDVGGKNWEYFVLNDDGTILVDNGMVMRGADLMGGACRSCHAAATANDFIFTK